MPLILKTPHDDILPIALCCRDTTMALLFLGDQQSLLLRVVQRTLPGRLLVVHVVVRHVPREAVVPSSLLQTRLLSG